MRLQRFAFAAVAFTFGIGTTGFAAKKIEKPIDGPQLKGPIETAIGTPPEVGNQETGPKSDLAYGAFQRGYYLTALKLALPRADAGDPAAQTLIAEIYWNGLGVSIDRKQAADWYRFAAASGNRAAQFAYANILLRGRYATADPKAGREFMKKAAQAGHVQAQFNLAQIITAERPTWAGFKRALPWYQTAADAGLPDAQYALANIYAEAKGVPVNDEPKALGLLEQAARGGLDSAQVEYGIWLTNGRGAAKPKSQTEEEAKKQKTADQKAAFYWFQRAAAQQNILAQNRLSRMYSYGVGTKRDRIKAAAWHILARRAGHKDTDMDQRFKAYSEIDKRRALELANRLGRVPR